MKCQKCDKPATFHITEIIGSTPEALHLCEEHAKEYLHKNADKADFSPLPNGKITEELKKKVSDLQETTRELMELDFKTCPICGLGFQDFRKTGRLGCPNDYEFFKDQLEPLLLGMHGDTVHVGKKPSHTGSPSQRTLLIRLRRELDDAVSIEDYERAGRLRDRIRDLELETT